MAPQKPLETTASIVKCEGVGPDSGHPTVYLNFGDKTQLTCPYCSQIFLQKK